MVLARGIHILPDQRRDMCIPSLFFDFSGYPLLNENFFSHTYLTRLETDEFLSRWIRRGAGTNVYINIAAHEEVNGRHLFPSAKLT